MHSIIILLVTLSFSATDETAYQLNELSFQSGRLPTSHLQKFQYYGWEESSSYSFFQADTFIFWEEDYENGANGWIYDSGWELSIDKSYEGNYSAFSPDIENDKDAKYNLISPVISLPSVSSDETIHFGFWLYTDMPDTNNDQDSYLDDYYKVSIIDTTDSYWNSTSLNSEDGNSFWCGDAELGGYMNSWIQYLDTPQISMTDSSGSLSARIYYTLEDTSEAAVGGSCRDGWDAANIRISTDDGSTWELLEDNTYPYDFECGNGWIWNDSEYDEGGSLHHLAKGWGGNSDGWQDFNADLSDFAGQNIIIRFAFGSDASECTSDDPDISGFQVDAISISDTTETLFVDSGDNMHQMTIITEVWDDLFYDYGGESRPGTSGWEFYSSGMPFNGNIELDISEYSEKLIKMKIQTQYDANNDAPDSLGEGLYIDNFTVYTQCVLDENACDCAGNAEDCNGECGGLAELDVCGICGGSGPQIVCQDGSIVCEMVDCPMISQTIVLSSGWNIMSFNNEPTDMSLLIIDENTVGGILKPLIDSEVLIKVQDETGAAIEEIPVIGWVNGIGDMSLTEGYSIKINTDIELIVSGQPITQPFAVELSEGWNIIGYPVNDTGQPALILDDQNTVVGGILKPLIDSEVLIKVQDETGAAIEQIPVIGWVDGIVNMINGKGYRIKISQDTILEY